MRVAFVVSDFSFPFDQGLHQQTGTLINALNNRGVDVELVGFSKNESQVDLAALHDFGISFALDPIRYGGSTITAAFKNLVSLRSDCRSLSEFLETGNFDVVHFEGPLACSLAPRSSSFGSVLSLVDPGSRRFFRAALQSRSIRNLLASLGASVLHLAFEVWLSSRSGAIHVVSISDRSYLRRWLRRSEVVSVPTAIPPGLGSRRVCFDEREGSEILIFCDLRLAHMRKSLIAIGSEFERQSHLFESGRPRIRILGRVPLPTEVEVAFGALAPVDLGRVDDYVKELAAASVVVVPDTFGTGIKQRSVQALAMGSTVVGFESGFEGIPVVDQIHVRVAKDAEDLVCSVARLLRDPELRRSMGAAASGLAQSEYSSDRVTGQWLTLYAGLAALATN